MKKFLMIFAFFVVIFAASTESFSQRVLGGYKTAAVDDEGVTAAADFAVQAKSDGQEVTVLLESIAKAESQVVAGTNYRLCLSVYSNNDDGEKGDSFTVQVVVNKNLQGELSLKSWTAADCAPKEN